MYTIAYTFLIYLILFKYGFGDDRDHNIVNFGISKNVFLVFSVLTGVFLKNN
jgi:hypothetical protein